MTFLKPLREKARRLFQPQFDDLLSPLERQIRDRFEQLRDPSLYRAVLIFTDTTSDTIVAHPLPHGKNANIQIAEINHAASPDRAKTLIAALDTQTGFEEQWSLKPGLLTATDVLARYPLVRLPELVRKLPPRKP